MDPETIARQTLEGLARFLKETYNESVAQEFLTSLQNWSCTWNILREWILYNSLQDMPTSILSFAKTLPKYETFEWNLKQSLTLHEMFWNKVYSNFCLVKNLLTT